ncbi:MAG TPA: acetylxylan esterase [Planctomycetota bacterium]|nr:acetylxylan esterase [Planctomycetota bacterium]
MKHDFPFDPTYGYTLERMLTIQPPAPPEDFERFWRSTYEAALNVPLNIQRRKIDHASARYDVFEIEWDSLDRFRVGAWLTVPTSGIIRAGFVCGHGYGSRTGPDLALPVADAVGIFPCGRGFSRSAAPGLPDNSSQHVVHGIESRETYIHRGCAADFWTAGSVLLELFPSIRGRLFYRGGSFGGGIGALSIPWDKRFVRAHLGVPSFGNHPLRVTLPCVGSGESVRQRYIKQPAVMDVLKYFDAATAAAFFEIPVLVDCAVFDPAVPPPGQFCVYNAIKSEKELFVLEAAHFEGPNAARENVALWKKSEDWFGGSKK